MSGGEVPGRQGATTPPKPLRPLLVTHSGTFHLDDAFAYAVLRPALGHALALLAGEETAHRQTSP